MSSIKLACLRFAERSLHLLSIDVSRLVQFANGSIENILNSRRMDFSIRDFCCCTKEKATTSTCCAKARSTFLSDWGGTLKTFMLQTETYELAKTDVVHSNVGDENGPVESVADSRDPGTDCAPVKNGLTFLDLTEKGVYGTPMETRFYVLFTKLECKPLMTVTSCTPALSRIFDFDTLLSILSYFLNR